MTSIKQALEPVFNDESREVLETLREDILERLQDSHMDSGEIIVNVLNIDPWDIVEDAVNKMDITKLLKLSKNKEI
jgi:hypothetical protein